MLSPLLFVLCCLHLPEKPAAQESKLFQAKEAFIAGLDSLEIPEFEYDYRHYFNSIPGVTALEQQRHFFLRQRHLLDALNTAVPDAQLLDLKQMKWECAHQLARLRLEETWVKSGRNIPSEGLHSLPDHREWYQYFIRKFTSLSLSPEEIFSFGTSEVARIKYEIGLINYQSDTVRYIRDKDALMHAFQQVDSLVRQTLPRLLEAGSLPEVYAMECPDANPATPPGAYLNRNSNSYGKDVFQYNFYDHKFPAGDLEWLYMHEAIPGHHLQSSFRQDDPLQRRLIYPGNFEGWACYVEYFGDSLGLYNHAESRLGKLNWDLVRSARVVLDAGIHFYGWDQQHALEYWRQHVPGHDHIAEREISRVTNWCGQALAYKVGADYLFRLSRRWLQAHPDKTLRDFHTWFLRTGNRPLTILSDQY
ncbi:MAG: DUF885 domain-containing protein [Sphingobacteriales bacterium]|nr:MAG: DUF885 domain-containing protein [Sphingobacteriales bacterium]